METAYERNWATLENGELLSAAEQDGFEILVTTDLNLKFQQDLASRNIAIVVISTPSWPRIEKSIEVVVNAVDTAVLGSYAEVEIP